MKEKPELHPYEYFFFVLLHLFRVGGKMSRKKKSIIAYALLSDIRFFLL